MLADRILPRPRALRRLHASFRIHPCVALFGPRQCGKTTLAGLYTEGEPQVTIFDFEREADLFRLSRPELALGPLRGLVVLDEIQCRPNLFAALRPLLDHGDSQARFLLLGSASPTTIRGVSESLAGRVGFVELGGFDVEDVGPDSWRALWERGGFPRSALAANRADSLAWRIAFARTFLERDIPALGISIPGETLGRFWRMTAHYHGQTWNAREFARSIGRGEAAARRYLDLLVGAYVIRALPPWFENLKKRQVRAPKVYVRDTGLLHALLGVACLMELTGRPKVGASFEGFVIEQVLSSLGAREAYFWGTYGGAELDLLIHRNGKRFGFEAKYTDAPRTTRSMRIAMADLGLDRLFVVTPGEERYPLDHDIEVLPARDIGALPRDPALAA